MRGWSFTHHFAVLCTKVIPANAGVILTLHYDGGFYAGYPRECGGDPVYVRICAKYKVLSPRMRGWSWWSIFFRIVFPVIPANAGVILYYWHGVIYRVCYPRECGGDPNINQGTVAVERLSPRMRGWSCVWSRVYARWWVIPANAGVILYREVGHKLTIGYPRECGGDPITPPFISNNIMLSPRMRGWSQVHFCFRSQFLVIPANAGVILRGDYILTWYARYPRECGGDPDYHWNNYGAV